LWNPLPDIPFALERIECSVWTGTELICLGAFQSALAGARYNPTTNRWTSLPLTGSLPYRVNYVAVWMNAALFVWGGSGIADSAPLADGAVWDQATNIWSALPMNGAPSAREFACAAWTGNTVVVWGGKSQATNAYFNDGARYGQGGWIPMSTVNAPGNRAQCTTAWSGSEILIFGGFNNSTFLNDGGRYNPATDIWTLIPSSPKDRFQTPLFYAAWVDTELVLEHWGKLLFYSPTTNQWRQVARPARGEVGLGHPLFIPTTNQIFTAAGIYDLSERRWVATPFEDPLFVGGDGAYFFWTGQTILVFKPGAGLFAHTPEIADLVQIRTAYIPLTKR
jgi:hypothetical protein